MQEIQALKAEVAQLADAPRLRYSSSWQASQGEKDLSTVAKGILLILERLDQIQGTEEAHENFAGLLQLLAARSNDTTEDVLRKALNLYGLAQDALEKGNRLAILGPDDMILHEVIGFEPSGISGK